MSCGVLYFRGIRESFYAYSLVDGIKVSEKHATSIFRVEHDYLIHVLCYIPTNIMERHTAGDKIHIFQSSSPQSSQLSTEDMIKWAISYGDRRV